ncbi:MAG: ATP-binding cassette domain-containing protein, partial [Rhizobiales bacterium]|nr:ATP-binding cassette domain-containing protein [Hyphomicrobiales bacterium]
MWLSLAWLCSWCACCRVVSAFARRCGSIRRPRSGAEMAESGFDRPLVQLKRISKHFGKGEARVDALREVSLEVFPRQVVALLGPSGSGKTTLLNVIGCILDPSAGSMELDGDLVLRDGEWQRSNLRRLRLDKIGFIFQFHNLLPFLDATDNVAIVQQLAGADAPTARKRASALLA